MPKATNVNNIVIHTSAGFGTIESMKAFWKNILGWNSPGYHVVIDLEGKEHQLLPFDAHSNGVAGNNSTIINICYIGGVEVFGKDKNGQTIYKGKDTRNALQKAGLERAIQRAKDWLSANGKDVSKNLGVVGHRDYSKDSNADGIIASWERIKECPCFDAIIEYKRFSSADRIGLLPSVIARVVTPKENFIIYSVISGDTLSKIATKYKTTVSNLKTKNNLSTDLIKLNQKLKIYV